MWGLWSGWMSVNWGHQDRSWAMVTRFGTCGCRASVSLGLVWKHSCRLGRSFVGPPEIQELGPGLVQTGARSAVSEPHLLLLQPLIRLTCVSLALSLHWRGCIKVGGRLIIEPRGHLIRGKGPGDLIRCFAWLGHLPGAPDVLDNCIHSLSNICCGPTRGR